MPDPLRLSVLDQSPVPEGLTGADALANTVDLAELARPAGLPPLLGRRAPRRAVAGRAEPGGAHRAAGDGHRAHPRGKRWRDAPAPQPAEGRRELHRPQRPVPGPHRPRDRPGVRHRPADDVRLQRDRRQAAPDDFPQQLAELLGLLEGNLPSDHPFARLAHTLPGGPHRPEVHLLGSSPQSAIWAGRLGLPYSFADFINPGGAPIAQTYRDEFDPGARLEAPRVSVGAWVVCADTDEEAQRLASSSRMTLTLLRQGRLIPVPPPDKALRFVERQGRPRSGAPAGRRAVIGAPEKVKAGIEELARDYGAEEVVVVTITYDHDARRRSYELIAEAFGLRPAEPVRLAS